MYFFLLFLLLFFLIIYFFFCYFIFFLLFFFQSGNASCKNFDYQNLILDCLNLSHSNISFEELERCLKSFPNLKKLIIPNSVKTIDQTFCLPNAELVDISYCLVNYNNTSNAKVYSVGNSKATDSTFISEDFFGSVESGALSGSSLINKLKEFHTKITNIKATNYDGMNLFHICCSNGDLETIIYLLENFKEADLINSLSHSQFEFLVNNPEKGYLIF